jgi:hypothetical protein
VLGQAALLAQPVLLWYGLVVAAAMVAFMGWYEEPALAPRYGAQYAAYRRAAPAHSTVRRTCSIDVVRDRSSDTSAATRCWASRVVSASCS